ncbi:regulatory protein RecX [Acidithiobacillus sp.]|uniref:regulatory protein RecX n=1 Tax=Acidithiobacillus sp. TaxID=1872118 RepID=UPI0025BFE13C|nr:regulatory protein RecX [Acidithiobacillus sp.]
MTGSEAVTRAALEARALRHLARREYARTELRRLLLRSCADQVLVDAVLDRLEAEGLLSDARYAEARLRSTRQRGFGPWRLRHDLQRAGARVDDDALLGDTDWREVASLALEKRFGSQAPTSPKDWGRRVRFLQARGFPGEIIAAVLRAHYGNHQPEFPAD